MLYWYSVEAISVREEVIAEDAKLNGEVVTVARKDDKVKWIVSPAFIGSELVKLNNGEKFVFTTTELIFVEIDTVFGLNAGMVQLTLESIEFSSELAVAAFNSVFANEVGGLKMVETDTLIEELAAAVMLDIVNTL